MKLYMPTKVYNEKGCVRQHSQELAALGTKALLVTGKHSSRVNGSLQDVKDALNREQVPYVVFDGIEENPCDAGDCPGAFGKGRFCDRNRRRFSHGRF